MTSKSAAAPFEVKWGEGSQEIVKSEIDFKGKGGSEKREGPIIYRCGFQRGEKPGTEDSQ